MTGRAFEILEAVFGVTIVSLVSLFIPGHWGLLDIQPHPLWLVVLATAIRSSRMAGYVSSVLAATSYSLLIWVQSQVQASPITAHDFIPPFLVFVAGIVVNELQQAQRQRLANVEQKHQQAAASLQEFTWRYQTISDVKAELEAQLMAQTDSMATLYDVAKQLGTLQSCALYPAILDAVMKVLGAQACALYLRHNEQLQLQAGCPHLWLGRAQVLNTENTLISRAFYKRQVASIRDCLVEQGPDMLTCQDILMAGPLLDGDGEVLGIVVIEDLPFLKFTPATIQSFTLILDWASMALQNALLYEQARQGILKPANR